MADKKIIWKQKTGTDTYDTIYPQTTADQVIYNGSTIKDTLDNIGTDLGDKYVTLDTEQTIKARKVIETFSGANIGLVVQDDDNNASVSISPAAIMLVNSETSNVTNIDANGCIVSGNTGNTQYSEDKIIRTSLGTDAKNILLPTKSGTLALEEDIKDVSITNSGSGNAVTGITANGHTLTVTKSTTFATTAAATQTTNGLMSSTDKKNHDTMWAVWTADGTDDTLVNKVEEVLSAFASFEEGDTIIGLLANKADKTALNDYVTLNTKQTIEGKKYFNDGALNAAGPGMTVKYGVTGIEYQVAGVSSSVALTFPIHSGRLAVIGDIPSIPSSLPPSGNAGGDLTGTYPNPTIGAKKVTGAKIADGTISDTQLSNSGVPEGTYSTVAVTEKGRVIAGAQLFTIGTSSSIPSTVPTGGFYLQGIK